MAKMKKGKQKAADEPPQVTKKLEEVVEEAKEGDDVGFEDLGGMVGGWGQDADGNGDDPWDTKPTAPTRNYQRTQTHAPNPPPSKGPPALARSQATHDPKKGKRKAAYEPPQVTRKLEEVVEEAEEGDGDGFGDFGGDWGHDADGDGDDPWGTKPPAPTRHHPRTQTHATYSPPSDAPPPLVHSQAPQGPPALAQSQATHGPPAPAHNKATHAPPASAKAQAKDTASAAVHSHARPAHPQTSHVQASATGGWGGIMKQEWGKEQTPAVGGAANRGHKKADTWGGAENAHNDPWAAGGGGGKGGWGEEQHKSQDGGWGHSNGGGKWGGEQHKGQDGGLGHNDGGGKGGWGGEQHKSQAYGGYGGRSGGWDDGGGGGGWDDEQNDGLDEWEDEGGWDEDDHQPPAEPHYGPSAQSGWMSWGREARNLNPNSKAAFSTAPTQPTNVAKTRAAMPPPQRTEILNSLLNQPNQNARFSTAAPAGQPKGWNPQLHTANPLKQQYEQLRQQEQLWAERQRLQQQQQQQAGKKSKKNEKHKNEGRSKDQNNNKKQNGWDASGAGGGGGDRWGGGGGDGPWGGGRDDPWGGGGDGPWGGGDARGGNDNAWGGGDTRDGNDNAWGGGGGVDEWGHGGEEWGGGGDEDGWGANSGNDYDPWGGKKAHRGDKKDPGRQKKDPRRDKKDPWNEKKDPWDEKKDPWNEKKDPWNEKKDPWNEKKDSWNEKRDPWNEKKDPWNEKRDPWGEKRDPWNEMKDSWNEKDPWGETDERRVHFSPTDEDFMVNTFRPNQLDSKYDMPSKTLSYARQGTDTSINSRPVRNQMQDYADVKFLESKGAALESVQRALYSQARLAKNRIHWLFPSDKNERVAWLLEWIQSESYRLGAFGLHKFLQSRERGALFVNAEYRSPKHPNEPAFDWLTFDDLQPTMDQTLQGSVAQYNPYAQVIVFVLLPSQTGNSIAIWRRKIAVPNNMRLAYSGKIKQALAALRKDYILHVDESPSSKPASPLADSRRRKKKTQRSWWKKMFFVE